MTKKTWYLFFTSLIIFIFIIVSFAKPIQKLIHLINFEFSQKNALIIKLSQINEGVRYISSEPSNKLVLRVVVKNNSQIPVKMAHVSMSVSNGAGSFSPSDLWTDDNGESLVSYIPPELSKGQLSADGRNVELIARISGTDLISASNIQLVGVPVVLIHGYQESASIFDNMKEFLDSEGYKVNVMDYTSQNGVVSASIKFNNYIEQLKESYLLKGIQVRKFDIIAHSMGGLVVRYYTCCRNYISKDNIRKIIFVSVPQKGSPWASIGKSYFSDQGINDLIPDNTLLTTEFPLLLNKGLNNTIEIGSIMAEFDEVVTPESASLSEWNIKTDVFNVGKNNFTMENILSGNIMDAVNHKSILNNKKAFDTIQNMLNSKLPYPSIIK